MSTKTQREQLLDCMFDVADADDGLAHVEVEAVCFVADSLVFKPGIYRRKVAYRERAKGA